MEKYRYKVVTKDRRSATISKSSPYCIKYKKGEVVNKIDGTVGIFTFENADDATEFINLCDILKGDTRIIRVIPIGKCKKVKEICHNPVKRNLDNFYRSGNNNYTGYIFSYDPPDGTRCYNSVLVVD